MLERKIVEWIKADPVSRAKLAAVIERYGNPVGVRGGPLAFAGLAAIAYRQMIRSGLVPFAPAPVEVLLAAALLAREIR